MCAAVAQANPTGIPTPAELGFDPAGLRRKYVEERTKRLRADANNQYQEITGKYAHYNDDPYVDPGFTRPSSSASTSATGTVAALMLPYFRTVSITFCIGIWPCRLDALW